MESQMITANQLKCSWRFTHPGCPRPLCGLQAGPAGLCIFHSDGHEPSSERALLEEVAKPDHWLEAARIKQLPPGVNLSGAKLPRANFEGTTLVNVILKDALLDGANFRSAMLR